ncbi:hypothetical protein ACWEPC_25695 [Nonomuraea sp. NPDC004297]
MPRLRVGAVFGVSFVLVITDEPLDSVAAIVLRITAVLAAGVVLVMWFFHDPPRRTAPPGKDSFAQPTTIARHSAYFDSDASDA